MYIIQIKANESGSRPPIQSWSGEIAPDGFAACTEAMRPLFTDAKGFVNIAVENGVVLSMTENTAARKAWESIPIPESQPTPDEDRDAMLADQEYRLTMLELGLT